MILHPRYEVEVCDILKETGLSLSFINTNYYGIQ